MIKIIIIMVSFCFNNNLYSEINNKKNLRKKILDTTNMSSEIEEILMLSTEHYEDLKSRSIENPPKFLNRYSKKVVINYAISIAESIECYVNSKNIKSELEVKEIESIYNELLRSMMYFFPQLNLNEMYYQEEFSDRNIFTLKAFEQIYENEKIKYLKEFGMPLKDIYVLTFDNFGKYLLDLEQINPTNGQSKFALLRHTIPPHQPHITPIISEFNSKTKELEHIILDTLGIPYDNKKLYNEVFFKKNLHFVELLADIGMKAPLLMHHVFFTQKFTRQRDMLSCGVFSFHDILDAQKENLFDYVSQLEKNSLIHRLKKDEKNIPEISSDIRVLSFLPPIFLRNIQDYSMLSHYINNSYLTDSGNDLEYLETPIDYHDLILFSEDNKNVINYRNRKWFFKMSNKMVISKLQSLYSKEE